MSIRRITATMTFDPPVDDEEEAMQALIENLCDDCADTTFERNVPPVLVGGQAEQD